MKKISVGILGATGVVGQQYLCLLQNHPWFEITFLASSENSAGKTYSESVQNRWHAETALNDHLAGQTVYPLGDIPKAKACRLVFSALPNDAAAIFEHKYAEAGIPVVSNSSHHRMDSDVPVLIPEVNADHLDIISSQRLKRGWHQGFIVVKPNCSLQSFLIPLSALHKQFPISKLAITTMQAASGAGFPGVPSLNILENIIPYIPKEEEKTEIETLKILGALVGSEIKPTETVKISSHCNRVPVLDGHMACVSVAFEIKPTREQILNLWNSFQSEPQWLQLPSAPKKPIIYRQEPDRPQPRLDRNCENGMAVSVGRLRDCNLFDYRFIGLSHNTMRGAAGGGILNAELLVKKGWI